jgi:hypothetical protein
MVDDQTSSESIHLSHDVKTNTIALNFFFWFFFLLLSFNFILISSKIILSKPSNNEHWLNITYLPFLGLSVQSISFERIIASKLGKENTFMDGNMLCGLALLHMHKDNGVIRKNVIRLYVGKMVNDSSS